MQVIILIVLVILVMSIVIFYFSKRAKKQKGKKKLYKVRVQNSDGKIKELETYDEKFMDEWIKERIEEKYFYISRKQI